MKGTLTGIAIGVGICVAVMMIRWLFTPEPKDGAEIGDD